jgi:hypothetical protein
MPDLSHSFGADLSVSGTGDLATADGSTWTQQRIIRRLCTNQGAYLWQLIYGAGLPARIGDPVTLAQIQSLVQEQMTMEAGVDQSQPVTVAGTTDNLGTVRLTISYTDAASGLPTSLTLPT